MSGLLIVIVLFGLMWALMIRPQRARAQQQQRMLSDVAPGDEVLTVGGLYGIVQELEPDEDGGDLIVEIAERIHVRIARKALAAVVKPDEEGDDDGLEAAEGAVGEEEVKAGEETVSPHAQDDAAAAHRS